MSNSSYRPIWQLKSGRLVTTPFAPAVLEEPVLGELGVISIYFHCGVDDCLDLSVNGQKLRGGQGVTTLGRVDSGLK